MTSFTIDVDPTVLQDIVSQPAVWRTTLELVRQKKDYLLKYLEPFREAQIVMTGCGTSYYMPLTGASLYTAVTGGDARGVPASDIITHPSAVFARNRRYLLIAISRSGKTPETVQAARYVKESIKGGTIAISCTNDSELSRICDLTIVLPDAAERSKYMTKSFTAMLLAWQWIVAMIAGDEPLAEELALLPQHGDRIIEQHHSHIEELAARQDGLTHFVYLGHGPFYGLAAESMLKTKEMAHVNAEVYHSMELMHGPKYGVDHRTLITLLLSDSAFRHEAQLLRTVKDFGATLMVVCDQRSSELGGNIDHCFELGSGLPEYARLLLYMPVSQLFAYHRAVAVGRQAK